MLHRRRRVRHGCCGPRHTERAPASQALRHRHFRRSALTRTKANVEALGINDRVVVLKGSSLSPSPSLVQSTSWSRTHPIPTAEIDGLSPEIAKHEPRLALDGGTDGLDVYRQLIPQAASRAWTAVLVEHGDGQHDAIAELMRSAGLRDISEHKDLTGTVRVVAGLK